jgi:hypothetical protein
MKKLVTTLVTFVAVLAVPAGAVALWTPWNFSEMQASPAGDELHGWLSSDTATLALGGRAVALETRPQGNSVLGAVYHGQPFLNISHGWEYTVKPKTIASSGGSLFLLESGQPALLADPPAILPTSGIFHSLEQRIKPSVS